MQTVSWHSKINPLHIVRCNDSIVIKTKSVRLTYRTCKWTGRNTASHSKHGEPFQTRWAIPNTVGHSKHGEPFQTRWAIPNTVSHSKHGEPFQTRWAIPNTVSHSKHGEPFQTSQVCCNKTFLSFQQCIQSTNQSNNRSKLKHPNTHSYQSKGPTVSISLMFRPILGLLQTVLGYYFTSRLHLDASSDATIFYVNFSNSLLKLYELPGNGQRRSKHGGVKHTVTVTTYQCEGGCFNTDWWSEVA
jgi:hypothetical protein